jgi:hypothetical protein
VAPFRLKGLINPILNTRVPGGPKGINGLPSGHSNLNRFDSGAARIGNGSSFIGTTHSQRVTTHRMFLRGISGVNKTTSTFAVWGEFGRFPLEHFSWQQTLKYYDRVSHTKVTKLERNALLGRGMDLNSLTWLLVTCVLFQMYTTLTLIQSAFSFSDATTWHPDQIHLLIFNTLHFTLLVWGGGEEVPCNLTQVVSNTPGGTLASRKTITTFYESTKLDSGEPNTSSFSNTFSQIVCGTAVPARPNSKCLVCRTITNNVGSGTCSCGSTTKGLGPPILMSNVL